MMKLEQFLADIEHAIEKKSVICLQATDEYPLLFCRSFITFLAKKLSVSIISQSMDTDNDAAIMASLQTTFLGQSSWYWLHADVSLSKKSYEVWHDFLHKYTGPHTLIFCTIKSVNNIPPSWRVIQLPSMVDARSMKYIYLLVGSVQSSFHEQLFAAIRSIPHDTALLLCQYALLIKKNNQSFFTSWLPQLVTPDISLFTLSQTLFDRKAQSFFMQWQRVALLYSPQFWVSFWSEQFWRASWYIRLQKSGKKEEAKKIGYRLPFSFLNNSWRTYSSAELQNAHALLYDIDYHLKNGGSEYSLELLYAQFFNKSLSKDYDA